MRPESGPGASEGGKKMSLAREGDTTRAVIYHTNLSGYFAWELIQIRKRLRISFM